MQIPFVKLLGTVNTANDFFMEKPFNFFPRILKVKVTFRCHESFPNLHQHLEAYIVLMNMYYVFVCPLSRKFTM